MDECLHDLPKSFLSPHLGRGLVVGLYSANQVPLVFRLDARDPLREKKAKFWRMDGPEQRRLRLCVSDNDATRSALSILRIIVADAAEMAVVEGKALWCIHLYVALGRILAQFTARWLSRS